MEGKICSNIYTIIWSYLYLIWDLQQLHYILLELKSDLLLMEIIICSFLFCTRALLCHHCYIISTCCFCPLPYLFYRQWYSVYMCCSAACYVKPRKSYFVVWTSTPFHGIETISVLYFSLRFMKWQWSLPYRKPKRIISGVSMITWWKF